MIVRRLRDAAWRVAATCARPVLGRLGCILTLHRVVPERERSPLPSNRALEITPEDLRAMLQWLERCRIDVIGLDDLLPRLRQPAPRRFVCFTFDDGYRDNLEIALPIFREFGAPFAVNVTNGFVGGTTSVWWYFLEETLRTGKTLEFSSDHTSYRFAPADISERNQALDEISKLIRSLGTQRDHQLRVIAEAAGIDPCAATRRLCLCWEELNGLAADPLVTIGAHTATHHSLNRLSEDAIAIEVAAARNDLATRLAREVRHFAYPFGGPNAVSEREFAAVRRAGFTTMLTTRAGNLVPSHADRADRLPRLTISGNYPVSKSLWMAESGLAAFRDRRRGRT
jgi:peptidoglycan/xylan/chitin deacetylase (PgdA/CDA1 family)